MRRKLDRMPLDRVTFQVAEYWEADVRAGDVVYLDPPYAGTTGYGGTAPFDSGKFWLVADYWVELGAHVFVSEYTAPDHWGEVWSMATLSTVSLDKTRKSRVERLYTRTRN